MKIFTLFLLQLATTAFGQQADEWINHLENSEFSQWKLRKENLLSSYSNQDFSRLLLPKTEFLGYIGSDYQRIRIKFTSVEKSTVISNVYYVLGSSVVDENMCNFEGTITVEQVREFEQMHFGVDDIYKDKGIQSEGLLIARFYLSENPKQRYAGMFDGVMTAWWYLDQDGVVQYDNLESHSDRYRNNQYVGTWTKYGNSDGKVCNWGEYRIPFSKDLDIGAGEFSVNPKYYYAGWEEFKSKQ